MDTDTITGACMDTSDETDPGNGSPGTDIVINTANEGFENSDESWSKSGLSFGSGNDDGNDTGPGTDTSTGTGSNFDTNDAYTEGVLKTTPLG
jgi:hypothetical protein